MLNRLTARFTAYPAMLRVTVTSSAYVLAPPQSVEITFGHTGR